MKTNSSHDRLEPVDDLTACIQSYQQKVEEKIRLHAPLLKGCGVIQEACEYALLNGGKRFRPCIVFMMAKALGRDVDVTHAALAVECFHTASLVADDLPCMDDDDERRNKPSVHKKYGEATALLVSYALIAAGYGGIAANAAEVVKAIPSFETDCNRLGVLALENASFNTGLTGATGGQFLDIFPPDLTLPTLRDVIHKKTTSLFEIAFVFGWLFGGGNPDYLPIVKRVASHFGMAFQIADDLGDVEQDMSNGRKVNMAIVFGVEAARQMFHEETVGYKKALSDLGVDTKELIGLADWLETL